MDGGFEGRKDGRRFCQSATQVFFILSNSFLACLAIILPYLHLSSYSTPHLPKLPEMGEVIVLYSVREIVEDDTAKDPLPIHAFADVHPTPPG